MSRLSLLALTALAVGCPSAPAPQPKPKPTPDVAPVDSAAPAAPPAPAATPEAPAPAPAKPLVQESPALRIRIVSPKPGATIRYGPVTVRIDVLHEESLEAVRINGREAEWRFSREVKPKKGAPEPPTTRSRTRYQLRLKFPVSGKNPITVEAEDEAGRVARRTGAFLFQPPDGIPPTITLLSPADGASLSKAPVVVKVRATDAGGVARVTINGAEVTAGEGGVYQAVMSRPRGGANRLRIDAWDRLGNQATLRAAFTYRSSDTSPPRIQLIDPDTDVAVREAPVRIVVRVVDDDGGVERVRINGKPAKLGKDGFWRYDLERPLVGLNPIRIVAWDPAGNRATLKTQFRFE